MRRFRRWVCFCGEVWKVLIVGRSPTDLIVRWIAEMPGLKQTIACFLMLAMLTCVGVAEYAVNNVTLIPPATFVLSLALFCVIALVARAVQASGYVRRLLGLLGAGCAAFVVSAAIVLVKASRDLPLSWFVMGTPALVGCFAFTPRYRHLSRACLFSVCSL